MIYYQNNNYLYHYGVKGQKWGVRRYQNADGSLTPAGQKRYQKAMKLWKFSNNPSFYKNNIYKKKAQRMFNELGVDDPDTAKAKKEAKKQKQLSRTTSVNDLYSRFDAAKAKNPNLTYDTIYKSAPAKKVTAEWKSRCSKYKDYDFREDTDYYKDMEDAYFRSLGL